MPRRKEHVAVGQLVGVLCAAWATRHHRSHYNLAALAGGFLGGQFGGLAPDVLEPAISPNHRAFFHSVTGNAIVTVIWSEQLVRSIAKRVDDAHALPESVDGTINWEKVIALFVAGLVAGFAGGYASHVVLDGCSPKSLPL